MEDLTDPRHLHLHLPFTASLTSIGHGLTTCRALGAFAVANLLEQRIHLFTFPDWNHPAPLKLIKSLGGPYTQFPKILFGWWRSPSHSCYLACTDDATAPVLLASDSSSCTVHVIDPIGESCLGRLDRERPNGVKTYPRGVACKGTRAAVMYVDDTEGASIQRHICLYEVSLTSWVVVHTICDIGMGCAFGIRFSNDSNSILVAADAGRVHCFDTTSGLMTTIVRPKWIVGDGQAQNVFRPFAYDAEEWAGGWVVTASEHGLRFISETGTEDVCYGVPAVWRRSANSSRFGAAVQIPGQYALAVLQTDEHHHTRVAVYATSEAVRFNTMSEPRLAWMVAAAKSVLLKS